MIEIYSDLHMSYKMWNENLNINITKNYIFIQNKSDNWFKTIYIYFINIIKHF